MYKTSWTYSIKCNISMDMKKKLGNKKICKDDKKHESHNTYKYIYINTYFFRTECPHERVCPSVTNSLTDVIFFVFLISFIN